ncbi:hypothetical protein LAA29_180074 [Leuconostoc carnosum]|nr:hypothetical protein LCAC16_270073 [Leuconostoc carnosum]SPO33871.1 hypothetical protein LAA29_180074 [Leuconostoc carnosum]
MRNNNMGDCSPNVSNTYNTYFSHVSTLLIYYVLQISLYTYLDEIKTVVMFHVKHDYGFIDLS